MVGTVSAERDGVARRTVAYIPGLSVPFVFDTTIRARTARDFQPSLAGAVAHICMQTFQDGACLRFEPFTLGFRISVDVGIRLH